MDAIPGDILRFPAISIDADSLFGVIGQERDNLSHLSLSSLTVEERKRLRSILSGLLRAVAQLVQHAAARDDEAALEVANAHQGTT